jgi:hypothetical protein
MRELLHTVAVLFFSAARRHACTLLFAMRIVICAEALTTDCVRGLGTTCTQGFTTGLVMSTLVVLHYLEKTVLYSRVSRLIVLDVKDGHTLRDVCTAATTILGTTTQVRSTVQLIANTCCRDCRTAVC